MEKYTPWDPPPPDDWKTDPFSTTYDKVRRSYGIAAALLLSWSLIGIDLQADVLSNYKITLKSPQAAPYVLIAGVVYFAFRLIVEWHQTNPVRRSMLASRVDYRVAHSLGCASIVLFAVQRISKMQVANLGPTEFLPVLTFTSGSVVLGMLSRGAFEVRKLIRSKRIKRPGFLVLPAVVICLLSVGLMIVGVRYRSVDLLEALLSVAAFAFGVTSQHIGFRVLKKVALPETVGT
jgi:hypothetical protein